MGSTVLCVVMVSFLPKIYFDVLLNVLATSSRSTTRWAPPPSLQPPRKAIRGKNWWRRRHGRPRCPRESCLTGAVPGNSPRAHLKLPAGRIRRRRHHRCRPVTRQPSTMAATPPSRNRRSRGGIGARGPRRTPRQCRACHCGPPQAVGGPPLPWKLAIVRERRHCCRWSRRKVPPAPSRAGREGKRREVDNSITRSSWKPRPGTNSIYSARRARIRAVRRWWGRAMWCFRGEKI